MTLWTPQGNHEIRKPADAGQAEPEPDSSVEDMEDMDSATRAQLEEMSPEEREQTEALARELAATREQLAAAPAEAVVANHLFGFYELAAIHLTAEEPKLTQARLAIDALGAVLDALQGRLGDNELALRDARSNLQMLYVRLADSQAE